MTNRGIPVCYKLCGHRSLFVTACVKTNPCLSQTVCVDTDPFLSQIVWTQILVCHKLCEHRSLFVTNCDLWQTGICVHTVYDKQGSVSIQFATKRDLCPHTQFVINRDLFSHRLWQTGNVCRKLCGHRSLFITNCVDTDPCLSQPVWTQIPACHKKDFCPHTQLVTNRDLLSHRLWQTGICVHAICSKQGSVSTFVTNCEDTNTCLSQTV
jgi:hypothetical protein